MKLLIVTTVSGTMNFFEYQINMLLKKGYDIHLASNFNLGKVKFDVNELTLHQIDFSRSVKNIDNIKAFFQLKDLLNNEEFDIIHTHTPIASALVRFQRKNSTKIIYTAHGFHFFKGAPLKNWLCFYPIEKFLSRKTDVLVTINEEDFKLAQLKFKNKNIKQICGVGIDLLKFQNIDVSEDIYENLGIKKNDFILTCIGELNNNKNQKFLINLMKNMKEYIPSIKLLLVGDGTQKKELQEFVKAENLGDRVIFLGRRDDIPVIIELSNIIISVSFREGLPVNLMEGMANGKPLIVSNCRGSREIVNHDVNGYVIDNFNKTKYKEKILKLYNDKDLYNKMSTNSFKMSGKYDKESINKEILQLYESLRD